MASAIVKNVDARLQAVLDELHRRFEMLYGDRLVHMVLFGSRARGDAQPESDVDVLVVLRGPVDPGEEILRSGEVVASLSLQYDMVLSRVVVSAEQFDREQSPLLLNVRREGISI
jgi:predicted nucleotidyltransferase